MTRALLVRGLIAGLAAGVTAAVFAYFFGEPHVDAAIALEEAAATAATHEEALVSRGVQSTVGLLVASTAFGTAMGALFALAFSVTFSRSRPSGARAHSAALAIGAFTVAVLVPFLKYPGNPPAVGNPGTIGPRTELYFAFLLISIIAAAAAWYAAVKLVDRLGGWMSGVVSMFGYVLVVAVTGGILPTLDEVAADFPATLLWDFRISSLAAHAVLWAAIGLSFGALAERVLAPLAAPDRVLALSGNR